MIIDTDSPPPWASLSTADICTYSLLDTAIRWQHNDHLQPSACQEGGGGKIIGENNLPGPPRMYITET